jgi:hypothetical protein
MIAREKLQMIMLIFLDVSSYNSSPQTDVNHTLNDIQHYIFTRINTKDFLFHSLKSIVLYHINPMFVSYHSVPKYLCF